MSASSLCSAYVPLPIPVDHGDYQPLIFIMGLVLLTLFALLGSQAYRKTNVTTQKENPKQETPATEERRHGGYMSEMSNFDSEIDPVVEAETYLAFGRDTQAEEILVGALITDPKNIRVKIKLLEIYSYRRDVTSFNETLLSLSGDLEPNSEDWNKVLSIAKSTDLPIDLSSLISNKPKESLVAKKDSEFLPDLSAVLSRIKNLLDNKDFNKVVVDVKESKARSGSSAKYTITIKID